MKKKKKLFKILNKMTPKNQYYYLKEIPTNEPRLSWPEGKSISIVKKIGEKSIVFEDDINK